MEPRAEAVEAAPEGRGAGAPGAGRARWLVWVLLGALVLLAVGLRVRQHGNTVDDAYITYRYAHNLRAGHGLVYNPGEAVLGTSSPAYALLLAGIASLPGPSGLPAISLWLNAVLDGAVAVGLFALVVRLAGGAGGAPAAGLAVAALWAVDAKSVDFSTGGMESPLFAACLVGVALLLVAGRPVAAAAVAGASVWVRPDGGLLVAALLLALVAAERRAPWREAMAALAAPALGLVLATLFYGDPIPASLRAKAAGIYHLPGDHAARYLLRHLAGMAVPRVPLGRLFPGLPGAAREYLTLAATCVLPVVVMAAGLRLGLGKARAAILFLIGYVLLFLACFSVANPFMMGWYYVPLETAYLVLLGLGLAAAARRAWREGWGIPLPPGSRQALVGSLLLVLLLVPQLRRYSWIGPPGVAQLRSEWETVRERDYLQVGADLAAATGGRARVAAPEIGALGHAYPGPILDTVGLISPQSRRYYPLPPDQVAGNIAIPPDLIADARPDMVVFLEIFGRKGLLPDPRFQRDYRPWRVYPSRTFGSRGLLVFVRRDAVW